MPSLAEQRGYLQGRERRIRFSALLLLFIETKKIGVADQYPKQTVYLTWHTRR
jgi:hypothetical protein